LIRDIEKFFDCRIWLKMTALTRAKLVKTI